MNPLKQENLWRKPFFQKILNEVLKSFKEMISAYVKAVVKQREIKELVAVSCIFFVRSNFKT